jgi:tRNA A37 threonylcarbamoyladenosine biosynthesis protein TsaE
LYRLNNRQDLARLELFNESDIYVIEWGDKLQDLKPSSQYLKIDFEHKFINDDEASQNVRSLTLETHDQSWEDRLKQL